MQRTPTATLSNIKMRIFEVATPYNNPYSPDPDIGLMTLSDFLYYRNPRGKSHPDDVYDTTLASMNRPDRMRSIDVGRMRELSDKSMTILQTGIGVTPISKIIEINDKPVAVQIDDVLYYTTQFPAKQLIPFSYTDRWKENVDIKPSEIKPVKYIDEYVDTVYNVKEKNKNYYPQVINRIIVDDEQLTIRTADLPYKRNSGNSIAIFNEDGYIIATASDEWGATLLRVVEEYRGKNLGTILGKYWYEMNPDFSSGGFSPKGQSNSIRIWADRVRTFMKNGWYSEFVKTGEITSDKVKEIVSKLPNKKNIEKKKKDTRPAEPLIYSDLDNSFVIYDKKFFEDRDEKYIYAYGFLRDTGGKPYVFTLDYDKTYEKIATYVIFQIAYDNKEKLLIKSPPSDHISVDGVKGIVVDGDYAYLTQPALNLKKYANAEKQYRKQHDKYDEAYYSIIELANSKWN